MPLVAILAGLVMVDLAFRGTEHLFARQLAADFGQGTEFLSWAAAVLILGALGYVPALKTVSNGSVALVIVVLVLRNGGLFQQLSSVITSPPAPVPSVPLSSYGGSSSSGGLLGSIGSLFGGGGGDGGGAGGIGDIGDDADFASA